MRATFSDRIKEVLELRNMTQAELSKLSGVDKGAISRYVSGKDGASRDSIMQMSIALNVNPAWLMGFDVSIERDVDLSMGDQLKQSISIMFDRMSNEQKERVIEYAKFLSSQYKK